MKACLIVSIAIWTVLFLVFIKRVCSRYKSGRVLTPSRIMFAGTFVSATVLFAPIYYAKFISDTAVIRAVKTFLISVHHTIKLFVVDSEFEFISESVAGLNRVDAAVFSTFAAILFVSAPLLTYNFIMSFFQNVSAYYKYLFRFRSNAYVFSELNEKSIALARSVLKKYKHALIIFTDVFEKNEEKSYELVEQAKELGAICFKKDILSINFSHHSKHAEISFFTIGADEAENINQAFKIIEAYKNRKNTELYVFSTSVDGGLITASANKGEVKVRRIKDVRSLIYRTLYDMEQSVIQQKASGVPEKEIKPDLFRNAKPADDGMKQIGAVVVGCGRHGTEMVKTLAWFCQMDGYRVSIDVFDKDKKAESKFTALCPELMSEGYNGVYVDGEAQYMINFHSKMEVNTAEFASEIKKLKDTTYVFVSLGSDEENIKTAVALRSLFEQIKIHPIINAVVYSTGKKDALTGVKNFKGQSYDIDFVGDLRSLYSEEVIIDSELEQDALARHLKYGVEEDFWMYEYNYLSSMASALHMQARIACGIPGADKAEDDLTDEEKDCIETLEHRRWNAYMRSEGYIYSGSPYSESRNDLGKMHHNLVNFDLLSDEDKRKDRRVGSK